MGSDRAPKPEIEGAIQASRRFGIHVALVGPEETLQAELSRHPFSRSLPITVVHASEVITMEDKAVQAVRAKRDSSMRVGSRLVREGKAAAFISAGNTGAAMATAKMVLGGLPGVDRPALVAIIPTAVGTVSTLLDVGANVDCKPHNLEQFAMMGEIYFRSMFGTARPRVGLLSIGEEEGKGNELTREAYPLLKQLPINFVGNVEGRDIYNGKVDVIVSDGFVGNVALKTSEGVANLVRSTLKETLAATITRQVGYLLSRSAFHDFKKRLDHTEYGGAPLLGIRGACFITHGSSNANAIKNAVRVATDFAEREITAHIRERDGGAASCGSSRSSQSGRLSSPPFSKTNKSELRLMNTAATAFLFPGQGSQAVGMGKDLFERFPVARQTFEEADEALGKKLSQLCFEGPEDQLRLTENTQPAILTVSVAAWRVLEEKGIKPGFVAGHSLGEYSAHVAAGTISFADAVRTVRNRGKYMQEAVPVGTGAMAAILGMSLDAVGAVCGDAAQGEVCEPANINSPDQIVISGHAAAVERAVKLAQERGAKRAILLPVSAPFHCSLMKPAQERLAVDLQKLKFAAPKIPVVCNVYAKPVEDAESSREALVRQVTGSVNWSDSMQLLIARGVQTFVEVGPGKVLCGLMRQIDRSKKCLNVEDEASLQKTMEYLAS